MVNTIFGLIIGIIIGVLVEYLINKRINNEFQTELFHDLLIEIIRENSSQNCWKCDYKSAKQKHEAEIMKALHESLQNFHKLKKTEFI